MSRRKKCVQYIDKRTVHEFVSEMTVPMRKEFYGLTKGVIIKEEILPHYDVNVEKRAFMGKFHQHFVQKVIFNLKDEDWGCQYISSYASIFPFEVSSDNIADVNVDILEFLDADFKNGVREFLRNHFDDIDEIDDLVKLFLRNIHASKTTKPQIGPCGEAPNEDCVKKLENLLHDMKISNKKRNVFKLTDKGVRRYQHLYNLTRQAMKSFSPSQAQTIDFDKYDESYLLNLPKNNFDELYSLLDSEFYKNELSAYSKLFEKYLFFFVHAIRSEEKVVFFIDDLLFECLKSLKIFQKSRENPVNLMSHIANVTCIYQRKQHSDDENDFLASEKSLENIKKFFETAIRAIETCQINYTTEGAILESKTFACTNHEAFEVCFSNVCKDKKYHFIDLIIEAALSEKYFNRLCIYNVYLGLKTWMYNTQSREEILNFVRKYSTYVPKKLPPEYFITHDFEECFQL